jgi:hypothetical protein
MTGRIAAVHAQSSETCKALTTALLTLAEKAEGWEAEFKRWADSWAQDWDRFHHFLWMLQCYEYFKLRGVNVSFPHANRNEAKPDLLIKRNGQQDVYAECYFFSKWWPREEFLEHLLRKIDPNLSIGRTYNIARSAEGNPFGAANYRNTLEKIATLLTPKRLDELRDSAKSVSPQHVCAFGDVKIELEGSGEYQPRIIAHGDPEYSWPAFLAELSRSKANSNNLSSCRPNILMVNGLGVDFQLSKDASSMVATPPQSIDEVWITACGIDQDLIGRHKIGRVRRILRPCYTGSDLFVIG